MALLVLLAGTAGTGLVGQHLLLHPDRLGLGGRGRRHAGGTSTTGSGTPSSLRPGGGHALLVEVLDPLLGGLDPRLLDRPGSRGAAHLIGLAWELALQQEAGHVLVHLLHHVLEELIGLELVDEERILLLETGVLHIGAEVVHVAEVLLPQLVEYAEDHRLLELVDKGSPRAVYRILDVGEHLHVAPSIRKGDGDVDELVRVVLVDALDHRVSVRGEGSHAVMVMLLGGAVQGLNLGLRRTDSEFRGRERGIDTEFREAPNPESIKVLGRRELPDKLVRQLVEHAGDVEFQTLPMEGVAAAAVDDLPLAVHHIVVLEQALSDSEVVFLHLPLGALDGFRDHGVLDDLALLVAEPVHHLGHPLALEEAHQVVLKGDVELAASRISLTSGTAPQLAVDPAAVMALRADDGQTACGLDLLGQLDVGSPTGHVGGDGHGARLTRLGHHLGLRLVSLRIEHLVVNFPHVQHAAQELADLNRRGADEHRPSGVPELDHIIDDRVVFLARRLENEVLLIQPGDGPVGRDGHHVELVDVPQLLSLRLGRAGHAGQLVVHPEVVLERDRGVRLGRGLDADALFGLDGLVQSIGVAAPLHDAASLLVDNLDLVVHDHVVHVLLEQGVRLEQLVHGVEAGGFDSLLAEQRLPLLLLHSIGILRGIDGHEGAGHIGHGEEVVVLHVGRQGRNALLGQFDLVLLLVDDEEELLIGFRHGALVVLQIVCLGLEHLLPDALLAQELDERLRLGQAAVGAEQGEPPSADGLLVGTVRTELLLGLRNEPVDRLTLLLDELNHLRLKLLEFVLVALGCGTGDDQRSPRLVDEDAVHLVHDGVMVLSLHELVRTHGHVVPEVIEAELVVGAVNNVATVSRSALLRVRLVPIDAVHGQPVELEDGAHPFTVPAGQVIVHSHEVDPPASQRIQENRQCGHQGLALSRLHLGHLAPVEGHAADELDVVMDHVPLDRGSGRIPLACPMRTISFDAHEVAGRGEVAVHVRRSHVHIAFRRKPASRLLQHRERLRHHLFENLFKTGVNVLLQAVDLVVQGFLGLEGHGGVGRHLRLQFIRFGHQPLDVSQNAGAKVAAPLTQSIRGERLHLGVKRLDGVNRRLDGLHVRSGLVSDEALDDLVEGSNHVGQVIPFQCMRNNAMPRKGCGQN